MTTTDLYHEGYFERAEGSNYRCYGDESGWDPILNVLNEYKPPMASPVLLEVACAKGWFVRHALDWGWDAYGFDVSRYAIEHQSPGLRGRVSVHDATQPWYFAADGAVDVLVGWEFFEHIEESDVLTVWSEMLRVVRPGGLIVLKIGMPIAEDSPHYSGPDCDVTHVTMHDRSWWGETLSDDRVEPMPDLVAKLDQRFADRDWAGRFFAWRRA